MKTQRQDAGDGSLVLLVLGLAMWIWVVDGSHRGSLPALPSCRDFSLWVQFGRSERDFPVRSQAPGRVQMAKTQRWELGWGWSWDGARMGMEPPQSPRAPARPAQPGTSVGTEGTVTLPHPRVTAETSRGDTAELPAQSLLPRCFSIPTCWQEGWRGHHAAVGGLKSGSPPCPTGPGLWQWPSSLQRKKGFIYRDSQGFTPTQLNRGLKNTLKNR